MDSRIIHNIDCIKGMEQLASRSINILYTDPPYNMNSRYRIDKDGHYVFTNLGSDFMNKWEAMDGVWWEKYFKEAYRITKYGGYVIMHNIDRQSDMFAYYARKAGFMPTQKLYWLFISNFPKAVDVALMIDKKFKVKRKKIGEADQYISSGTGVYNWNDPQIAKKQQQVMTDIRGGKYLAMTREDKPKLVRDITVATHPLAVEFDGYKYGQACLKQILEEILVFWKPNQSGTIEDLISYTKGNSEVHPSIFNIRATMVGQNNMNEQQRHTPQMLISEDSIMHINKKEITDVLVKIPYLESDVVPYLYEPKASKAEKEEGLFDEEEVINNKAAIGTLLNEDGKDKWATKSKNPHPTPKPHRLCEWVLRLFKPPESIPIKVLDTFAGQGSIPKVCEELGIEWYAFELNPEYQRIAEKKINTAKLTLF